MIMKLKGKKTFFCIDAHTCGNPVRVVSGGAPILKGANMSEKRQYFLENYDWIRTGLMFEPRGHDMMSGSMLFAPSDPSNDVGILFIETSGCLPMCGHGTIGAITIAIEEGLISPKIEGKVRLETPAGLVCIDYKQVDGKVEWVKLTNVVSYLAGEKMTINSPDLGEITFDVSYGGNYYSIIDAHDNFAVIDKYTAGELKKYSQYLRNAINEKYPNRFVHPQDDTIRDVSHILWTGKTIDEKSSGRGAVFYGEKAIDRSPCGTGTSARMAQLHAKGLLKKGDEYIHESYIGSKFIGAVEDETTIDGKKAIIPSIKGWAKVTGYNNIILDESDPYVEGFVVV